MKWFGNRCRRRQDISLFASGALNEEEKTEVENHLAACQECRSYFAEIKTLTVALTGWEKKLSSLEATPAARKRWASVVKLAGASSVVRPTPWQSIWRIVCHELIWPSRYAWTGMAAIWLVILAVNEHLSDPRMIEASAHTPSALDMMQAWEEQNRVLAELTQAPFPVATTPPILPGPRSERKQDWEII